MITAARSQGPHIACTLYSVKVVETQPHLLRLSLKKSADHSWSLLHSVANYPAEAIAAQYNYTFPASVAKPR